MDRPVGLNWGCGPVAAVGWVNVDIEYADKSGERVVYYSTEDFADGGFDGIVANHSLQCIEGALLDATVQEFHRLLRPGGRLRVLVPDVVHAFVAYIDRDESWAGFAAISEPWSLGRKFAHYLTWGGQNRSCFTSHSLTELVERNGFIVPDFAWDDLTEWDWLHELDSRRDESLIAEVVKP